MLELLGLFVCLGGLIKFFSAWGGGGGRGGGTEKVAGLWFARGISTQADTANGNFEYFQ